ncbi:hypothetical protein [Streptomyces sp. NPDC004685]
MTTQTTECVIDGAPPISGQQQLIDALINLMAQYPRLPEAHITIHATDISGGWVDLQFSSPWEFETWREALEIQPADVDLHVYTGNQWMSGDAWHMGVRIHITGFEVPVTPWQAAAQRTVPTPVCGSQCPQHAEHQCRRSPSHQPGICRDQKQKGTESCTWDATAMAVTG